MEFLWRRFKSLSRVTFLVFVRPGAEGSRKRPDAGGHPREAAGREAAGSPGTWRAAGGPEAGGHRPPPVRLSPARRPPGALPGLGLRRGLAASLDSVSPRGVAPDTGRSPCAGHPARPRGRPRAAPGRRGPLRPRALARGPTHSRCFTDRARRQGRRRDAAADTEAEAVCVPTRASESPASSPFSLLWGRDRLLLPSRLSGWARASFAWGLLARRVCGIQAPYKLWESAANRS